MSHRGPTVLAVGLFMVLTSTQAHARDYVIQPVQVGAERVRFEQGGAQLDLTQRNGSVQITPLPMDGGSLAFGVAVFNAGAAPANIGLDNISVASGNRQIAVLTPQQLVGKAKGRAMWRQFGLALTGSIAAGISANQRDVYHSTFQSRYGTSTYSFSAPSFAGQLQADRINQDTAYGMATIRDQLDQTRERIGAESLQLSTVDPGRSYAGRIVVAKFKPTSYPQRVDLSVEWNGELYQFAFQIAPAGTPQPSFANFTVATPREVQTFVTAPVQPLPVIASEVAVQVTPMRQPIAITKAAIPEPKGAAPASLSNYEATLAAQKGISKDVRLGWTASD